MMLSVIVNYGIPNLVKDDVKIVRETIEACGLRLLRSKPAFHMKRFSATDYLFASTYVARVYPHLIESQLVLMYRVDIPEPIQDKHKMANLENRLLPDAFRKNWKHRVETLFLSFITVILWVGALNPGLQKVVLNVIPSIFFVSCSFMVMLLSNDVMIVSITIAALLLLLGPLVIQITYYRYERQMLNDSSKTTPLSDANTTDNNPVDGATGGSSKRGEVPEDEESGLHDMTLGHEADWMYTSSESDLTDYDGNMIGCDGDVDISTDSDDDSGYNSKVDLNSIRNSIKTSSLALFDEDKDNLIRKQKENVTALRRDKLNIADHNVKEAHKRDQIRAKKHLAMRLKSRNTTLTAGDRAVSAASRESNQSHETDISEGDGEPAVTVRHSRSSIIHRRSSSLAFAAELEQLESLGGKSSSAASQPHSSFTFAKSNILETKHRTSLSRRDSEVIHDMFVAQNDATLLKQMEMADKKAAMYARLNARLKNRQLVDDMLASGDEGNESVVTASDAASIDTDSVDDEANDVVVTKVVGRRKKLRNKKLSHRKTKAFSRHNRMKTKLKSQQTTGLTRKTKQGRTDSASSDVIMETNKSDDDDDDDDDEMHYMHD